MANGARDSEGDGGGRHPHGRALGGRSGSAAAPAAGPPAARGRDRRGPRGDLRGRRRRHRTCRHRRRAGVGLSLLLPRLPDPGAPRGRRHPPDRPDRVRDDGAAAGGDRGHRVDPARRHPGPPLPRRGRPGAGRALRHRAGRTPPGLPARGPGRPGRVTPRGPDGQGALRGRLVDPAAAGAVAGLRRPRRRGARRAARAARQGAGRVRQGRLGGRGVRRAARLHPHSPGRCLAAYVGTAPRPWSPLPRGGSCAVGAARQHRPGARRDAGPDPARLRDRGRRHGDAGPAPRVAADAGIPRPGRRALRRHGGPPPSRRSPSCPRRSSPPASPAATARRCPAPGPRRTRSPRAG